ncbi:MAG TPA: nickel-dependent hydrogenase large subunit, partial [Candidatus Limnocylindrales bacterium]
MTRLVVDPVARVGGHLRVEVDVAEGAVRDAWSSATMFRGVELILRGRDARDAWLVAERICGSWGATHALGSLRAVESALGVALPRNARLIRNVIGGVRLVANHVAHFYHRQAFDWVDVRNALTASPNATARLARSQSERPTSASSTFADVRDRFVALVGSGQPGPVAHGYWGHSAYAMSPEADLLILAHYLEAFEWLRIVARIETALGGKGPHPQSYLVGGMALAPEWRGPARPGGEHPWGMERTTPRALSADGISDLGGLVSEIARFVDEVYLPDVVMLAEPYGEWFLLGAGVGNYLSFGEFPEDDTPRPALLLPRGRLMRDDLSALVAVDQSGIGESVAHSWYADAGEAATPRHPRDEETEPRYAGPPPPVTSLAGWERYSWLKAPRYEDDPMEVGPLARQLVAAAATADGQAALDAALGRLGRGREAAGSTLGRTLARAVEAQVVAARLPGWLGELTANLARDLTLVDITRWQTDAWPAESEGHSLGEGSRGAIG